MYFDNKASFLAHDRPKSDEIRAHLSSLFCPTSPRNSESNHSKQISKGLLGETAEAIWMRLTVLQWSVLEIMQLLQKHQGSPPSLNIYKKQSTELGNTRLFHSFNWVLPKSSELSMGMDLPGKYHWHISCTGCAGRAGWPPAWWTSPNRWGRSAASPGYPWSVALWRRTCSPERCSSLAFPGAYAQDHGVPAQFPCEFSLK